MPGWERTNRKRSEEIIPRIYVGSKIVIFTTSQNGIPHNVWGIGQISEKSFASVGV